MKRDNMYRSYKEFNGYSTAFRQHKADSHCKYIHGYALRFKVWFDGELDYRNWVVDFGCFKRNGVKDWFKHQFDHTTVISVDDPERNRFEEMDKDGLIQLRIMEDVGCEKFAEYTFNFVNEYISSETDGRVKLISVEVFEHGANSAIFKNI